MSQTGRTASEPTAAEPTPIVHGVASALSPMLRRIVCANPSAMTGPGTNTYLIGVDEIAVVDPGPDDAAHLDAVAACGGDRIRWILLTHHHSDHAPGARGLKERTGAEILAHTETLPDGTPVDRQLADGDKIEATEYHIQALHTPGHASDHLCFLVDEERTLLTGDHIMQGSTVVIAPPDGDMGAYLTSLDRLTRLRPRLKAIAPGHGHLIERPYDIINEYITHRRAREDQVLTALTDAGTATVPELVAAIYTDVPAELHPVAAYSVWAHLRKLAAEGKAQGDALDDPWSVAD